MFHLGQVFATPGAIEAIKASGETSAKFLARHSTGDWGNLCDEDKALNDDAVQDGSRILSAYRTTLGQKLWVITEAVDDNSRRAATTILLPEEY